LFVNPDDSPMLLLDGLAVLHDAGLQLVRLFLDWNRIEPREGVLQWSPYQEIFDEAAARDMKVVPTLTATYPPGWMNLTHGLQDCANLDDPQVMERSLAHVRAVVKRFRDHPALDSWILWNEPGRTPQLESPQVLAALQTALEQRYETVEAYNACHFRPVRAFRDILLSAEDLRRTGFVSHRIKCEWLDFSVENLQHKLAMLAREVRGLDPEHPIHVNPHRVSQCLADKGQSLWRQAGVVDFMGCSSHPAWHSVRFRREHYGHSVAMFADLARSASRAPDHYFWVTELQGGSTILSAFEPLTCRKGESRLWLWESLAAGAKAVVYWCSNARTDGYEAGEWDLLDSSGRPTPQLEEISDVWKTLAPWRDLLAAARPSPADVGILISEESNRLDLVEGTDNSPGNPRNSQRGSDATCGAYLLAAQSSLEVAFFDLDRFLETPIEDLPPVLLLPSLTVVSAKVIQQLEAAAHAGRLVLGDGFFAWKDPFGRLAREEQKLADELWGAACVGHEAIPESESFAFEDTRLGAFFVRTMFVLGDAVPAGAWTDGRPAVVRKACSAGAACRIGTQFFQRYFLRAEPDALETFQHLLEPWVSPAFQLAKPVEGVRLRSLRSEKGDFAIVINSGTAATDAQVIRTSDGKLLTISVAARDAALIPPAESGSC
jgi:beta-galactosidase